jgi:hypothetical protein
VRTAIPPGHARPWGPKLSVLFRRSYAFPSDYSECLNVVPWWLTRVRTPDLRE